MATLTLRREDGRIVCERVVVADRAHRRMRGLLGRKYLREGEGMVLRPGWSIHTAFMRFPIDAVFLDADQVVIKIEPEIGAWRTVSCRGAREVVELSAGECHRRLSADTTIGSSDDDAAACLGWNVRRGPFSLFLGSHGYVLSQ